MVTKTKVIGDAKGWFVVEYDPDYPAESTEIIGEEYPTREEAEANLPQS